MPDTIFEISNKRLQPAQYPDDARTANGKYGASQAFHSGSAIGRKTSDSLLYPCVTVNDVQNLTPSAAATAGTFTITLRNASGVPTATTALAYNASIATIQTALDVASGVANGVVATSAGSVAPMSSNVALVLTFSGTGYTNLQQPLVAVDASLLTGATVAVTDVQPNRVQTVTPTTAASAGHFVIGIMRPTGVMGYTGPIVYTASIATIQTALDLASGAANGVVAAGAGAPFSSPNAMTLTFSGTGYAGLPQPLAVIEIGGDVVGTTKITVDDTTVTRDGTEVCVGFTEFAFRTDASSKCYLSTTNTTADMLAPAYMTLPYFTAGTFLIADLVGFNNTVLAQMNARLLSTTLVRIP